jgi:TolB-like protein/class 3 adenylate cyclase
MEPTGVKRKLTVILAADVEGYSRLMGANEEATHKTLRAYREIIDGLIARHDGRVFSTAGDSVVAEFASPVEAVRAAISIQEELRVRNTELPEDRQMRFRIGVNLGDVIVDGDDIYGDGVNVAARLEGVAEPSGICISGSAFEQVKNKLSVGFEDIGPQEVKNIAEPVPAFRIVAGPVSVAEAGKPTPKSSAAPRWRTAVIAAGVIVAVVAGGLVIWDAYFRAPPPPPVAVPEEAPAPGLPAKPSIAVLPFANLSDDPKQEYFSDGITEDLITDLSKISGLFVIARNSVFTYKGRAVKVQQVAKELGVRYVLEGSVRRAEGKVRINAQLVDASTGGHLWAQRYDRDYKEIFALQDEITGNIVSALALELTAGEGERVSRRDTDNVLA